MQTQSTTSNEEEIKAHRLIDLANFLANMKMNYPIQDSHKFTITKNNSGFELDADNFTFVWVIGLMPLVFGKYWAYSNSEKIILKEFPDWGTSKAIRHFFGLSFNEYFYVFVAYFQEDNLTPVAHDNLDGSVLAENIRTIARSKLSKIQTTYVPPQQN